MTRHLRAYSESWPIEGNFTISRGSKTQADVVVVEITQAAHLGRGECVPYARYGESVEGILDTINGIASEIAKGADRQALTTLLPPGAARNAIDCALLDLEAKQANRRAWELLEIATPLPTVTAFTLSLDTPEKMAAAAKQCCDRPLIKLKLGGDGDADRIRAVRAAAPNTRLIIDANEAWTAQTIEPLIQVCAEASIELIEQPLPADNDAILGKIEHPVLICADESIHGLDSLDAVSARYDAINIKLDKTGGITEALVLAAEAERRGLTIMVGCMLATSLAMAPALLLANQAAFVDLDGPLLLARDRVPGLRFVNSVVQPPVTGLWG